MGGGSTPPKVDMVLNLTLKEEYHFDIGRRMISIMNRSEGHRGFIITQDRISVGGGNRCNYDGRCRLKENKKFQS